MKIKSQQLVGIILLVSGFIFFALVLSTFPDQSWPQSEHVVFAFLWGASWAAGVTLLIVATAKEAEARTPQERKPKCPKVHTTRMGSQYVNPSELLASEAGQKAIRELYEADFLNSRVGPPPDMLVHKVNKAD